jgi:hypothetical protein
MPIDDRSFEAMVPDHAIEFFGGTIRGCGWHDGESSKARRVLCRGICEEVVGFAREGDCLGRFELLCAGGGERQHLHINACCVHLGDSLVSKIGELLEEIGSAGAEAQSFFFEVFPGAVEKSWTGKMFFEGYGSHFASLTFCRMNCYLPVTMFAIRVAGV